jgi:amino acid adenylation domain-containing protein
MTTTLEAQTASATVLGLFATQVAAHPDGIALRHHGTAYTYGELGRWSAAVAADLVGAGVGEGDVVALSMDRSPAMIAAVLAVVRAGAGYLALDSEAPERWRVDLLGRLEPRCLLVGPDGALSEAGMPQVEISVQPSSQVPADPPCAAPPDDAVFQVAPTSGTTGTPRLVRISYRSMLNRLKWMWQDYPFPDGSVVAVHKPPGLVASPWEMLGGLLQGVPSVVLDRVDVVDSQQLASTIAEEGITHLYLTPHVLAGMLAEAERTGGMPHRMRLVTSGADALPPSIAVGFRRAFPEVTLLNLYGMTETSSNIAAYDTMQLKDAALRVPVGRPVAGAQITVLDKHSRPVPIGVTGEICVSGPPLALGYYGNEVRTAARFIRQRDGTVLFRTGDLGRWLPEGWLEVTGRADNQIKIRGYRIELEEVEAVLAGAHGVTGAGACVLDDDDGPVLVGCVVANITLDLAALRRYLHDRLPEYLVPTQILQVNTLPRRTNGKLDRAALARLAEQTDTSAPAAIYQPDDPREWLVAQCWTKLIGTPPRDSAQSFFESGGHSLLAMRLIAELEEASGRRIDLRLIFADASLRGIAIALGEQEPIGGSAQ